MATRSHSEASAEIPLKDDLEKGEAGLRAADGEYAGMNSRFLKEAAGLLFAFSLFALVEGTARMAINSNPEEGFDFTSSDDGTRIPGAALLAGGIAEVIFGLSGCLVAIYSLFFDVNSPTITLGFVGLQAVLGWFVFLTYVVTGPILRARFGMVPPFLSQSEYRALVIIGEMFGGMTFCYALQGGQFIMGLNLMAAQKGAEWNRKSSLMRATVWSINTIIASFSTIFVGSMLAARDFDMPPFPVPPHVVWFPSLSIVTGILMLLYGIVCLAASRAEKLSHAVGLLFPIVVIMMLANFSWVFGKFPGVGPPIVGSLQHIGLVFSVAILPAYHAIRAHREP